MLCLMEHVPNMIVGEADIWMLRLRALFEYWIHSFKNTPLSYDYKLNVNLNMGNS